ncbi:MAG TPA: relaxase/mobilization nuclease domain-containing protein [Puia sp.]|nr:relaxase/mobilization nuclease domain-containing protein [Puia sp.]
MVAKIKSGKSLTGALNYNENKVKQGKADLIEATGYHKDLQDLNFYDKLFRLTDLAEINQRTKTNAVHISLNFATGENPGIETLKDIVKDYMLGIGFESQPCLVYRHYDAGHPHIHIVSTNIKRSGERISLHYLGQNESEKIRKAIEIKYGLIKAGGQSKQKPVLAEIKPAEYGKAETKRTITNILGYVLSAYKFTSIPELNAVLNQYHIHADRGAKESRMYAKAGLVYWILDKSGRKTGVPVKASSIYGKPTMKILEDKFRLNETLRKPLKAGLIKTIDEVRRRPQSKTSFQQALDKKGVRVLFRQNDQGKIYGVTFIDRENKAVFNGSDLGKAYSANLLTAHFKPEIPERPWTGGQQTFGCQPGHRDENPAPGMNLTGILFQPEQEDAGALNKIKREQNKKKRKGLHL